MLLIKSQALKEPIDLTELMKYSLTPVPHSLGTPDGFFNKTNKAATLHFLTEDLAEEVAYPTDKTIFIQDGNALFHALTNLPPTFGAICLQMLDQMVAKKDFVFSTDSYHPDSIKNQERMRRGYSQKYIVDGPATRKPVDFKLFLANDDNKTQLCQLLLQVWGGEAAASRLDRCGLALVVVEGKAYQLTSSEGAVSTRAYSSHTLAQALTGFCFAFLIQVTVSEIHELVSNQEETDTRVVLYLKYAVQMGYKSAVVRTPDTDIFLILLHHACTIPITMYLDTGTGKHRQIINVTELAERKGAEYCTAMLGLYVYTGEDVTSAFKGKGKLVPLKKLHKNQKFNATFRLHFNLNTFDNCSVQWIPVYSLKTVCFFIYSRKLGDEWQVEPQTIDELEAFTCLIYGYPREVSVNTVRSLMLKKMVGEDARLTSKSKVDLSRLPPCKDNLIPHVQRVNHRLACYKRADKAIFWRPKPYDPGQGWERTDEGLLEPTWCSGPVLPPSLVDLIESSGDSDEEDEEDEDDEIDFDELFNDDEDD